MSLTQNFSSLINRLSMNYYQSIAFIKILLHCSINEEPDQQTSESNHSTNTIKVSQSMLYIIHDTCVCLEQ